MKRSKKYYFFVAFFIFGVVSSLLLTLRVATKDIPFIDQWASPFVQNNDGTILFSVFRWTTELGSGTFLIPFSVVISLFLWLYGKDLLAAIMTVTTPPIGYKLNYWMKLVVERERPRILHEAEGIGYSFPSGHAMVAFISYGLCIYFLVKLVKSKQAMISIILIGMVMIILIGFSRYVIRVHYLSDVLAGFSFGFIFLCGWILLYKMLKRIKINYLSVSSRR